MIFLWFRGDERQIVSTNDKDQRNRNFEMTNTFQKTPDPIPSTFTHYFVEDTTTI